MTPDKIDALLANCHELERLTTYAGKEYMHNSARCFDACMRAFDCSTPARSVTFKVFFDAPVMKEGTATIYRSGVLKMEYQPGD